MRVKIRGIWYDAENEPIVVQLSKGDEENIANMDSEAQFYMVYPDNFDGDQLIKDIQHQIEEGVINKYPVDKGNIPTQEVRSFTEDDISQLQDKVHEITGDGDVMKLFNELLGINAC